MDKAAVSQGRASEGAGGGRDALVFGRTPIETARIRSIETRIVDLPLRRLQQFARFGTHLQSIVLVEILTEDGVTGIGEAVTPCGPWWSGDSVEAIKATIDRYLAPLLVGENLLAPTRLMAKLDQKVRNNGFAKAGIEMALLDGAGKILDVPLHILFGGKVRDSLPVAWPLATGDVAQEIDEAEEMLALGRAGAFKLKMAALPIAEDLARAKRLARALEGRAKLRVDPNEGWEEATAVRAIAELREAGIEMVEQPVARWNLDAMARLTRSSGTTIMIDEGVLSVHDTVEVVKRAAASLLSLKIMKSGGLRNARAMADIANAGGIPVYMGTFLESSIGTAANMHLAASLPALPLGGETIGPMLIGEDICVAPADYHDHALWLPEGPGLGIEIDREKLARFQRK